MNDRIGVRTTQQNQQFQPDRGEQDASSRAPNSRSLHRVHRASQGAHFGLAVGRTGNTEPRKAGFVACGHWGAGVGPTKQSQRQRPFCRPPRLDPGDCREPRGSFCSGQSQRGDRNDSERGKHRDREQQGDPVLSSQVISVRL